MFLHFDNIYGYDFADLHDCSEKERQASIIQMRTDTDLGVFGLMEGEEEGDWGVGGGGYFVTQGINAFGSGEK